MRHAIDTLRITRKLESVGVDRRQAEAHAEALNEVAVTEYSELATKTDLERFASREDLHEALAKFITKEDLQEALAKFVTKEDLQEALAKFITKEDLQEALAKFVTKEDLQEALAKFVTKEDLREALAKYATKEDLARLETRMFRLWAVSTVALATLIVSMPFVAG